MKSSVILEKVLTLSLVVIILAACIAPALPVGEAQASGGATFTAKELLCRPTDTSITVNVIPSSSGYVYFEYGTTSGSYSDHTNTVMLTSGTPADVVMQGLTPNTRYYYRMVSSSDGVNWGYGDEHSFYTQRSPGSTFTFTITADSHMNGGGGSVSLWQQALNNVLADHPDFHLDLGDTFWMDGVTSSTMANQRYVQQRVYMGTISPSVPIFVSVGNHEEEEAWHLDDTGNPATSLPVLSANARKKYFPNPVPDVFYSGNTDPYSYLNGDHLREDYFAWTWGDALFVVIDPYWYTTTKPYIGNAGGGESSDVGSGNRWDWTLGLQQFKWLNQTLHNSNAKYKFVLDHHPLGGAEDYVRGGAGYANLVEWGGYNEDGKTWGWDTNRPVSQWGSEPIHQIMVDTHVTAYFHGHDHLYAYEAKDGVVYQEVPSPSMTGTPNSGYYNNPYAIKVLPSPGHIRVTVSPSKVTVDYVKASLSGSTNGQVVYSYSIMAKSGNNPPVAYDQAVSTVENAPVAITLFASDADGDALSYNIVTSPSHGSLSGTGHYVTYAPNTDYSGLDSFTFKANDGVADSNTATVSITVTAVSAPPVAPSDLTATAVSTTQIDLSWKDNSVDESSFKIEQEDLSDGSWSEIAAVGPNVVSYSKTGLSPSTTYYYRVYAYNAAGNSGYSNTAGAATKTPDFSISASPNSLMIQQGSSASSMITIASLNDFNSAVDLSVSGCPTGATCVLSPTSVTPPSGGSVTSMLSINAGLAAVDTYTLTVTGNSGSLTHSVTISLTVTAPPENTGGWKVQSGTGFIGSGSTYATVNIDSVTLTKSFLLVKFGGGIAGIQSEQDVIVSGKFSSASQLRFDRTGTTNSANFDWYVIEALGTQISVQSGTTAFSSTETQKDVTVTDVTDTGKCVVFLSRRSTGTDATQYYKSFVTGELTSSTNLRLRRVGTGTTVTIEWFVVKFNDGTTIQTGETAVSTSNPTSQSISTVNMSRTWLYSTWRATANGLAQDSPRGWLESSTQIRWFRQTTIGTCYVRWFVIQMPSGTNVQRGYYNSAVTTDYTKDITIAPVALNRAFSFTTSDSTGTGYYFPRPLWIERITTTTNLHLERWCTGQTSDHNWQIIELPEN
jgi:hypothetical protein